MSNRPPKIADECIVCSRRHRRASPFCSQSCEQASDRERRRQEAEHVRWMVCPQYGAEWRATRADSVFCSGRCRQAALRARRSQAEAAPLQRLSAALADSLAASEHNGSMPSTCHHGLDRVPKGPRINNCRGLCGVLVACTAWIFCAAKDFYSAEEAKDGFHISGAVRAARGGADAGVWADLVGEGSAAVCGPRSGAVRTWRGRVHRRGSGVFGADH